MRSRAFYTVLYCGVGSVTAMSSREGLAQAKAAVTAKTTADTSTAHAAVAIPDTVPETVPGPLTAAAEIGVRAFSSALTPQQLGKFEEYRDLRSGMLLQQLLLGYAPADGFRWYQLTASNIGLLDQTVALRAKQPGLFDVQLHWDRIPHTFSTDGRSLLTEASPGVYTLPVPRPDTAAFNRAPFIGPIRSVWDPVKLAVAVTPSEAWDFKAEYTRIGKSGDRPMGQAFGGSNNNASEILEPIDQTVDNLKVSQSYAEQRFQLVATYDLSVFQNNIKSVASDNPLVTTSTATGGSSQARTSLAPSNLAHTAIVVGGLNLPLRTRITGSAALSWWRQNDAFIPATSNTAITDPRIAQEPKSLGGSATTDNMSASISSRPLSFLTFAGRFRSYSFADHATTSIVPLIVLNDRSVAPADTARRDPFSRRNADFSGTWQLIEPVSLTAGYAWEQIQRDSLVRNVVRTNERTPRMSLDFTGIQWVTLRASYSKGWRRGGAYTQTATSENPNAQRFDEADRNLERTDIMASATPIDPLTISGTWQVGYDLYPHSLYGVLSDRSAAAGADVSYTLTNRVSAGAGLMRETFVDVMRVQYRTGVQLNNPTYSWVGNNTDLVTSASADLKVTVIPDRLEAGGTYEMSRARYAMATTNPIVPIGGTAAQNTSATAFDLPQVTQNLQPIDVYVRYQFTRDWAFTARYHGELYTQNDYKTLGLNPATATSATNMYLFLANNYQNYDARYFTISFSYHPQLLRIGRSTI